MLDNIHADFGADFAGFQIRASTRIFVTIALFLFLLNGCRPADPLTTPTNSSSAEKPVEKWHLDTIPFKPQEKTIVPKPGPDDWFADVASDVGIDFTYRNGRESQKFTLMESVGGGAAIFDFDDDGNVDLFIPGGGTFNGSPIVVGGLRCGLFRNSRDTKFTDVSTLAGVNESPNYTLGCSVCDFNSDGLADLFVTGYPHCRLYCNQGDGSFHDVTVDVGLNLLDGLHAASTWADFDGDGLSDLYVTGYVQFDLREDRQCGEDLRHIRDICGIWQYSPAPDRIFRNLGNGKFEEITRTAGLRADGRGLGVIAADINADGHLDLYVANDYTPNFLYLGDGHGKFAECGLVSGTSLDENGSPQGSMGVDFGDYDGDGLGDFFVTNYQMEDNTLYRNLGEASFAVATSKAGLQNICRPNVGFGTGWVDWDSDGWLDLFVLNGHVMYHTGQSPYEQPAFLLRNLGGKRFENISQLGGPYFSSLHVGRGGAVGDLNNDGAPDLVTVHQNSPISVLINRKAPSRWFSVCLHGTKSEPFAIGAIVTAEFDGRRIVRHVRAGAGYFSEFDRRILLPADNDASRECTVRWLSGETEVFRNLTLGKTNQLIEGQGERS